jgi:hypothetical protein
MKTFGAVTALAMLAGLTSFAQAADLISAPLPTHVRETNVTTYGACRVHNNGTTAMDITVSLFSNNANVTHIDNCNAQPLAAGRSCVVTAWLPDDSYVACKLTAGNVSKLRGTLELRQTNDFYRVFMAQDLE